jgi:hypothetical protein
MSLAESAAIILWIGITLYAVLAGADFGAGLWDLLAGGSRRGARPRALSRSPMTIRLGSGVRYAPSGSPKIWMPTPARPSSARNPTSRITGTPTTQVENCNAARLGAGFPVPTSLMLLLVYSER